MKNTKKIFSKAINYILEIKPNEFKEEYTDKGTTIYSKIREEPGDQIEKGDIHILTRNFPITIQKIREAPKFDFKFPQAIAFQVNHIDYSDVNKIRGLEITEPQIDKICLQYAIAKTPNLEDLKVDFVDGYVSSRGCGFGGLKKVYQIISVPFTKLQVDGLLGVVEDFYNKKGERMQRINQLKEQRKRLETEFLKGLHSYTGISSQDMETQWKYDNNDVESMVLGDEDWVRGLRGDPNCSKHHRPTEYPITKFVREKTKTF